MLTFKQFVYETYKMKTKEFVDFLDKNPGRWPDLEKEFKPLESNIKVIIKKKNNNHPILKAIGRSIIKGLLK